MSLNTVRPNIDDIHEAANIIQGRVVRTPSVPSLLLSELSGAEIVLKLENLQHTGSFKPRGALVKLESLTPDQRHAGVTAASAGNHAQGVAFHAKNLGVPATIVMPTGTPFNKIARTESHGATVILFGENLTASRERAAQIAQSKNLEFISPYDDEKIIAGQGTIGLEMLTDTPDLDVLVVPIGGGGLIAGIATAAKSLKPEVEIVGVQAALYPTMHQALRGETPTGGGDSLADGIAVKEPGRLTLPVIQELVSEVFLVEEMALECAIQSYLEMQRIVVEGAGAASLAAVLENRQYFAGKKVGLIVSGGNIDSRMLSFVLMRGLVRAGRLVRLRVEISDTPGELARVTQLVGDSGGNIVEVFHHRLFHDIPVKLAELEVVVETLDGAHVAQVVERLTEAGYTVRQLSNTAESNVE